MRRVRELEHDVTAVTDPHTVSRAAFADRKHYGTAHLVATDKAIHRRVVSVSVCVFRSVWVCVAVFGCIVCVHLRADAWDVRAWVGHSE